MAGPQTRLTPTVRHRVRVCTALVISSGPGEGLHNGRLRARPGAVSEKLGDMPGTASATGPDQGYAEPGNGAQHASGPAHPAPAHVPDQPKLIAVDAMGGDYAPAEIVAGAVIAARELSTQIVLTGRPGLGSKFNEKLLASRVLG